MRGREKWCDNCGGDRYGIGMGGCNCPDPLEEDRPNPPPPKPRLTAAEWLKLNEADRQAKIAAKLRAEEEALRRWREAQEERATRIVGEFLARIEDGQDIWESMPSKGLPKTTDTTKEINDQVSGQLKSLGFPVNPIQINTEVFCTEVGKPTPVAEELFGR